MARTKLKRFQSETVADIIDRVKVGRGHRLALADEVGLGKTHIMGAAAASLISRKPGIIFYVAPSLEVADQNGPRLADDCGCERRNPTRLTLLPVELSDRSKSYLVSLSPGTSFNLGYPGNRPERSFLYAVFLELMKKKIPRNHKLSQSSVRVGEYRYSWRDVFYRPKKSWFSSKQNILQSYSMLEPAYSPWRRDATDWKKPAKKIAIGLNKNVEWMLSFVKELESLKHMSVGSLEGGFSKTARIITLFRYQVAFQALTESYRPEMVFLDEWHRYQNILRSSDDVKFGTDIFSKTMNLWHTRPSEAPKVCIFASATPFDVSLESIRKGDEQVSLSDLCRIMDPSGKLSQKVEAARGRFQKSWQKYRDHLISSSPETERSKLECEKSAAEFGEILGTFVLRTERPVAGENKEQEPGKWEDSNLPALVRFRQYAEMAGSGSDVVGLWSSASHFLAMKDSYDIAEKLKGKPFEVIKKRSMKKHWKREELKSEIQKRWGIDDRPILPPLWIAPFEKDKEAPPGKILVFSSWKAVPREVSFFLNDDQKMWQLGRFKTGSPLGTFPPGERNRVDPKGTWRIFYPSLFFSNTNSEIQSFFKWVLKQTDVGKSKRSAKVTDWKQILIALDYAFVEYTKQSGSLDKTLAARASSLNCRELRAWRKVLSPYGRPLKGMLNGIALGESLSAAPGLSLTRALSGAFGIIQMQLPEIQGPLMELCRHAAHYFNRTIAQRIVRARFETRLGRKGQFEYTREIVRYCREFKWEEMWCQYANIFCPDNNQFTISDYISTVKEMATALDSRAVNSGRGWWKEKQKERGKNTSSVVVPFTEAKATEHEPEVEGAKPDSVASSTSRRRKTFNSPFLPLVLVSTSIGQEGVDFHLYCDTVVHWNPPFSPLALEQREGRVDRYRSYQVRKALHQLDPRALGKDPSEMNPDFCVLDRRGRRRNQTIRKVFSLPFSGEYQSWKKCLERLHYFRLFLGSPDPVALEMELRDSLSSLNETRREKVLTALSEIALKLRPTYRVRSNRKAS